MPMNPDVKSVKDAGGHKHRMAKLSLIGGSLAYGYFDGNMYFTPEATKDTMEGTQFPGENHRRITPYVQALWDIPRIFTGLATATSQSTYEALRGLRSEFPNSANPVIKYDVVIIGSGPHGVAVAAYLREKRPDLKTLIVESNTVLGGQWNSYGPKPVFQMNSRVRKADRRIPSLPRTAGSINPLGKYAPLELSDIPTGTYAWNTDMGKVCAMNAFLSTTDVATGIQVRSIGNFYPDSGDKIYKVLSLNGENLDEPVQMLTRCVVDATGLYGGGVPDNTFEVNTVLNAFRKTEVPDGYFTAESFYRHFANDPNPLAAFNNVKVAVIGAGDSALTVLEALVGNLPAQTYGRSGVGRMRPERVDWIGARSPISEVERCLRTRYKNGIVQALKRDGNDECGFIIPTSEAVSAVRATGDRYFDLIGTDDTQMFPQVVVDCTPPGIRSLRFSKESNGGWEPTFFVGPRNGRGFTDRTQRKINALGIPENNVSLWATMESTDFIGDAIVQQY